MHLVSESINDYCVQHSSVPSQHCEDIRTYTQSHHPMSVMVTGPLESSFLRFLIGLVNAKRVLEVGCFTGYSTLAMAESLPDDGQVITLDIDADTAEIAHRFWNQSPHGKKIKHILGSASASIDTLKGPFDLVFLDADKGGYPTYLKKALPLLSSTGVVVADNCLYDGEVLNPRSENAKALNAFNKQVHQDEALQCTLLPVRDGILLIRKR